MVDIMKKLLKIQLRMFEDLFKFSPPFTYVTLGLFESNRFSRQQPA